MNTVENLVDVDLQQPIWSDMETHQRKTFSDWSAGVPNVQAFHAVEKSVNT